MKLEVLLSGMPGTLIQGSKDAEVTGLTHDSRNFKKGDLFIAVKGNRFDGHQFLVDAARLGAAALVVEKSDSVPRDYQGPVIRVADGRKAVDVLAANFYGRPSENLFVVGVTGTNGKTTTTCMIEGVLNAGHKLTGVLGTIDFHLGDKKLPSTHTTPDALALQKIMAQWRSEGAQAISMEVSSHSLAQGRVDSVAFDVAVFTNLTRDHLDFHGTMEEYIAAKSRLFHDLLESSPKKNKRAIINGDDPVGVRIKPPTVPTWTYGFNGGDFKVLQAKSTLEGTDLEVQTPAGKISGRLLLIGRHNIYNALGAMAVGVHSGVAVNEIRGALGSLTGVRGRLERVPSERCRVFVDYAHSDDALNNVLGFLKKLRDETSVGAKLITVFGCGGDRDRGKRPMMLKAALNHSDFVVVTSDNPRTEDPEKIIDDILSGADVQDKSIAVRVDRKGAIELALNEAGPKDVVLIAGKGHEEYQIVGTEKLPFDDVKVAKEILSR